MKSSAYADDRLTLPWTARYPGLDRTIVTIDCEYTYCQLNDWRGRTSDTNVDPVCAGVLICMGVWSAQLMMV